MAGIDGFNRGKIEWRQGGFMLEAIGVVAPSMPSRNVLWFFIAGGTMGVAATLANWNKGWPHWYAAAGT